MNWNVKRVSVLNNSTRTSSKPTFNFNSIGCFKWQNVRRNFQWINSDGPILVLHSTQFVCYFSVTPITSDLLINFSRFLPNIVNETTALYFDCDLLHLLKSATVDHLSLLKTMNAFTFLSYFSFWVGTADISKKHFENRFNSIFLFLFYPIT